MPRITALVHTENDGLRLGRCLETLYPCDEILIVDHGSRDDTLHVAHEYGARIAAASDHRAADQFLRLARCEWILCLDARESVTENLAASLYEWKTESPATPSAFSMFVRQETAEGWLENSTPETRLVPSSWDRWHGHFPAHQHSALTLEGDLLRFALP